MKWFNTNAAHNLINVLILLLTSLVGFDWTMFGIDAALALKIAGVLTLLKILMNVVRDGVAGLVKKQPAVEGN
ncbi:MAG: hypothetical protein E5Y88_27055 [Mesorhizobium sp.]|uniref:hypothetical protein n=1 Tax=unclassified Mesorhizobium TaxID=325217 RepID=UPI000FCB55E4|nr:MULTISPECIES: hypothetical protein [unclassified Mesorhizobium]RUU27530.1 hypothetical protein EOC94_21915 [Mesorhizobium sp. M6A.T.Ce.TU.016.01.1.1]RUU96680.1 hypothetical protein EOB36_29250 [Mesorhizobium sp. M6A.T.Cr.TU.017.01.1.1]RWN59706.1 MAG: hypothetical protein EOR99_33215 [Mesorhizobium sp.]RWQ41766.1 MAG: hypothetical protein EOS21_12415 [Mesorhizobium sp.]RWQ74978.1 MAG: hypothetical protein EOS85_21135 [Mesorhizobium sp.]